MPIGRSPTRRRDWPVTQASLGRHTAAAAGQFAEQVASELAPSLSALGPTAIELDLEPCLGVQIAAELNHRGLGHVVLVLPRWPHPQAILPVEPLLQTLIGASKRLNPTQQRTANVVFVIDGDRKLSLPKRPADDPRVDNRYDISAADLPNLSALRRADITRIVRVTQGA